MKLDKNFVNNVVHWAGKDTVSKNLITAVHYIHINWFIEGEALEYEDIAPNSALGIYDSITGDELVVPLINKFRNNG